MAFTQGLMWHGDRLYEGTGMRGSSVLSIVNISRGTWAVEKQVRLANRYFGEGIVVWSDSANAWTQPRPDGSPRDIVVQLTWQERVAFVYDAETLQQLAEQDVSTLRNEGWGITHDGTQLIVSDGSEYLFFWDPKTLQEKRRVRVTRSGSPVRNLNELEFIHGWVFANVWQENYIVVIDPVSGRVASTLDCSSLFSQIGNFGHDVLNGIAYKAATPVEGANSAATAWSGRLWLTGKYWDSLFEVEITTTKDASRRRRE